MKELLKKIRQLIFTVPVSFTVQECGKELKINGYSRVNKNTYLGKNVNLNGLIIEGKGKVEIGDNFHSGRECLFITQNHNYDNGTAIPYGDNYILKKIKIEDNVWLGSRVIVLGGVNIGEGAIIQAGSCVVSDIPKYAIAGGHPAEVFKQRNVEHYTRLKSKGKFH
jgi:acetyltransferase-like isoleucine patch superfamily enzyme